MKSSNFHLISTIAVAILSATAVTWAAEAGPMRAGETRRVGNSDGPGDPKGDTSAPTLSSDGRFVAFESTATDLIPTVTGQQCYLLDRLENRIELVSVGADGPSDGACNHPAVSGDGSVVVFQSRAKNLGLGDPNGRFQIYRHVRATGKTTPITVDAKGAPGVGENTRPRVSADGCTVVYTSHSHNLVEGDGNNGRDVLAWDCKTEKSRIVSISSNGTQGSKTNGHGGADISADGKVIVFSSHSPDLVEGDTNGAPDVFVRDESTGKTSRVSVASDGTQGNADSGMGTSFAVAISADGRWIAFESDASNLVDGDGNKTADVFLHDRESGKTTRASVSSKGAESKEAAGTPRVSRDGKRVLFSSAGAEFVPGDTNASCETAHWSQRSNCGMDIFIHEPATGKTTRISVTSDGTQSANPRLTPAAALSADGRIAAFSSLATNLSPDDRNDGRDVFLHALEGEKQ